MKIIKFIFQIVKWIIITGILLFSLALVLNKSYLQTLIFILIAAALVWWPNTITRKWNKKIVFISKVGFLILLISVKVIFLKGEPKITIYTSEENKETLLTFYDECCREWPKNTEDIYIETSYGKVHVLACGKRENSPLLCFMRLPWEHIPGLKILSPLFHLTGFMQLIILEKVIKAN